MDLSEGGASVIALVAARDADLKSEGFSYASSWLRHYRELPSDRKLGYMRRFARGFARLSRYLEHVRVLTSADELDDYLMRIHPSLVIIDDKLARRAEVPGARVVVESRVSRAEHRRLMLVADGLANYFRLILIREPARFHSELRKFEKP